MNTTAVPGARVDEQITQYDTLDEYTMGSQGWCRWEKRYHARRVIDEDGTENWVTSPDKIQWEKRYGTDLKLLRIKAGYTGYENEFNENNQVVRTTWMDETWHPFATTNCSSLPSL